MQDKTPKRRRLDGGFKKKVALEAIKGERTMQEIASESHVHPVQVSEWKKRALDAMDEAFKRGGNKNEVDKLRKEVEGLQRLVGQREYELEWLRKKSKELGL